MKTSLKPKDEDKQQVIQRWLEVVDFTHEQIPAETDVKTQIPLLKQDVVSWKQRQSQPLHKEQSDFMMHPATMKKLGPSEILKKRTIRVLPNEYENRYELLEPIPVDFENTGPSAVIASFLEAELSVTGYDICDAEADLMSWIIDMYDDLTSADPRTLGKVPAKQKRILRRHLRHSR